MPPLPPEVMRLIREQRRDRRREKGAVRPLEEAEYLAEKAAIREEARLARLPEMVAQRTVFEDPDQMRFAHMSKPWADWSAQRQQVFPSAPRMGPTVPMPMAPVQFNSRTAETRWMSNFADIPVTIDGVTYKTAEHAYQAAKTNDPAAKLRIMEAPDGLSAKRIGSKVPLTPGWDQKKTGVMRRIVEAKLSQHPELMERLKATGTASLEHATPWGDEVWGTGRTGKGQNLLGKMYGQIRDREERYAMPLYEGPSLAEIRRARGKSKKGASYWEQREDGTWVRKFRRGASGPQLELPGPREVPTPGVWVHAPDEEPRLLSAPGRQRLFGEVPPALEGLTPSRGKPQFAEVPESRGFLRAVWKVNDEDAKRGLPVAEVLSDEEKRRFWKKAQMDAAKRGMPGLAKKFYDEAAAKEVAKRRMRSVVRFRKPHGSMELPEWEVGLKELPEAAPKGVTGDWERRARTPRKIELPTHWSRLKYLDDTRRNRLLAQKFRTSKEEQFLRVLHQSALASGYSDKQAWVSAVERAQWLKREGKIPWFDPMKVKYRSLFGAGGLHPNETARALFIGTQFKDLRLTDPGGTERKLSLLGWGRGVKMERQKSPMWRQVEDPKRPGKLVWEKRGIRVPPSEKFPIISGGEYDAVQASTPERVVLPPKGDEVRIVKDPHTGLPIREGGAFRREVVPFIGPKPMRVTYVPKPPQLEYSEGISWELGNQEARLYTRESLGQWRKWKRQHPEMTFEEWAAEQTERKRRSVVGTHTLGGTREQLTRNPEGSLAGDPRVATRSQPQVVTRTAAYEQARERAGYLRSRTGPEPVRLAVGNPRFEEPGTARSLGPARPKALMPKGMAKESGVPRPKLKEGVTKVAKGTLTPIGLRRAEVAEAARLERFWLEEGAQLTKNQRWVRSLVKGSTKALKRGPTPFGLLFALWDATRVSRMNQARRGLERARFFGPHGPPFP